MVFRVTKATMLEAGIMSSRQMSVPSQAAMAVTCTVRQHSLPRLARKPWLILGLEIGPFYSLCKAFIESRACRVANGCHALSFLVGKSGIAYLNHPDSLPGNQL